MRVGHIFNEVEKNILNVKLCIDELYFNENRCFYEERNFNLDYFDLFVEDKIITKKYDSNLDLVKNGLRVEKDGDVIVKYDIKKLKKILNKMEREFLVVSGDFWGIQKFIFSNITASKAAKILRARSAKVEIITKIIAKRIEKLEGVEVLFGAGKFLIFLPLSKEDELINLQKLIDKYFLTNYFGEAGFIISYKKAKKEIFEDNKKMQNFLEDLANINEEKKFNKFNYPYLNENEIVMDIFKEAKKDNEICEFCKKRVASKKIYEEVVCDICFSDIKLGENLVKFDYIQISVNEDSQIDIINLGDEKFGIKFLKERDFFSIVKKNVSKVDNIYDISEEPLSNVEKWQLKSFVSIVEDEKGKRVKTFEELQNNSSGLMALKADVDGLGETFKRFYFSSFEKFNRLSRELNFFFSNYVPYLVKNRYKDDIYIIFSGGDDLFLLGKYNRVVELALDIRNRFIKFSLGKATLSMGMVMFKSTTPINFVSSKCDEAEKRAKNYEVNGVKKNAIDIFGITMSFEEFIEIREKFFNIKEMIEDEDKTAFYYGLLKIIELREKLIPDEFGYIDIKGAMWKSKLNYFARNYKNKEWVKEVDYLIEKFSKKMLPIIYLEIYKRRDDGRIS